MRTKSEEQWQAEDAARILTEAEKIKKDRKLLTRALKELRKQKQALTTALSKNK